MSHTAERRRCIHGTCLHVHFKHSFYAISLGFVKRQTWLLFDYFCPFLNAMTLFEKDGVLGIRTGTGVCEMQTNPLSYVG